MWYREGYFTNPQPFTVRFKEIYTSVEKWNSAINLLPTSTKYDNNIVSYIYNYLYYGRGDMFFLWRDEITINYNISNIFAQHYEKFKKRDDIFKISNDIFLKNINEIYQTNNSSTKSFESLIGKQVSTPSISASLGSLLIQSEMTAPIIQLIDDFTRDIFMAIQPNTSPFYNQQGTYKKEGN